MSSHSRLDSTSEREDVAQSMSEKEQTSTDYLTHESPADDLRPTTTVMIYLAGDNNLTDECIYALTELKKARPSHLVRVYVQFDPSDEFLPTQRYEINRCGPDHYKDPLAEDLIDQFPFEFESKKCLKINPPYGEQRERKGESGTGDPRMLYNFVAFCVDQPHKRQPAPKTDHYVLIICGHGAGIQRDYLLRDNRPDGYLTIYELRSALKLMRTRLKGKHHDFKLDLFGMDVCLMSMAEITYELRDLVDIAIGCESYSPAAGWPYCKTIQRIDHFALEAKSRLPENVWETISREIVEEYVRFYSDYWLGGLSVTISALRVKKIEELKHLLRALANEMIHELCEERNKKQAELEDETANNAAPEYDKRRRSKRYPPLLFSDALILAHWRAQSYNGELYVDLADFCDCLAQYMKQDSEIAQLCEKLAHFIRKKFTLISCSFGRNYQYSYGVSIYFPWQTLVPYYGASIHFPRDSNWISFLKIYLDVTRREPRLFHCKPDDNVLDVDLKRDLFGLNFTSVRMGPDKMGPDKMGLDEGGNPIHSMRNPPIVFIPDCCLPLHLRNLNAVAEKKLMKEEDDPKEPLRNSRIKALEEKNPAWVLLTEEAPVTPEQLEADNVDES